MSDAHSPRVAILMGSDSDLEAMGEAAKVLKHIGVEFEVAVTSAHRSPERTLEIVRDAERRGCHDPVDEGVRGDVS